MLSQMDLLENLHHRNINNVINISFMAQTSKLIDIYAKGYLHLVIFSAIMETLGNIASYWIAQNIMEQMISVILNHARQF